MTNLIKTPHFSNDLLSNFVDRLTEAGYPTGRPDGYPPYNVWVDSTDDSIKIETAASGFSKDELSIEFDGSLLTITGERKTPIDESLRKYIHRGLAKRKFICRYNVNGSFSIENAILKDGILLISLKKESKKIQIEIVEE